MGSSGCDDVLFRLRLYLGDTPGALFVESATLGRVEMVLREYRQETAESMMPGRVTAAVVRTREKEGPEFSVPIDHDGWALRVMRMEALREIFTQSSGTLGMAEGKG